MSTRCLFLLCFFCVTFFILKAIYLSRLMLVANALNSKFHSTMKDILKQDFNVSYQKGPLKRIERCQAKAETDYASRDYPSSACLLDIIRCTCVYKRPQDLTIGIKRMIERINKGDTALKRVLRIKNMFELNKKEAEMKAREEKRKLLQSDYLYQYADIKLNVQMDWNGMSMLVEVQLMLEFMLLQKKKGHQLLSNFFVVFVFFVFFVFLLFFVASGLLVEQLSGHCCVVLLFCFCIRYEITRSSEFRSDMSNVMSIATDKQQQLLFLVHSGKDNSQGVKELSQFLMNYSDEVDLGLMDKNGLNVFHYVCKLGKVRMLKLLLNVTNRDKWIKYFMTPAQLLYKPLCVHLAAQYNQVEMMKLLKQMSQDDEYRGVISLDRPDGAGRTAMRTGIVKKNYQMVKLLYDPDKSYSSYDVKDMIDVCLRSDDEYDETLQTQCLNFKFFQRLLAQNYVKGAEVMRTCVEVERDEYFDYVLENNDRFNYKFSCEQFWSLIGRTCNPKMMKSMLNTNIKGFIFSELKHDPTYLTAFSTVCQNTTAYSWSHPRESNAFRCFSLLLEREEIINVLKQNNNAAAVLSHLIRQTKVFKIDYLFEMNRKMKWKLDFTKNVGGMNSLQLAAQLSNYEACKTLIETGWFDINHGNTYSGKPPLLYCAESPSFYDPNNPRDGDNFKIFQLLLHQKNINIGLVPKNGTDLITTLYKHHKDDFVDYLKQKVNEPNDDNDWKLDETTIDDSVRKYKTVDALIGAVQKSDFQLVKSILVLKTTQVFIEDVMNMHGLRNRGTVLHTCVTTMVGWDETKPTTCANYKIFDILIKQNGVNLGYCDSEGYNVWHRVFASLKVSFLDLLISKTSKPEWKKYFNLPVTNTTGYKCTHLALKDGNKRNVVMLEKLKEMSMNKKFEGVIDMKCKNGYNETAFDMTVRASSYFYAMFCLFDEKADNRKHINKVIENVLTSTHGYHAQNMQCENITFFKQLLNNQPGISGYTPMRTCIQHKKVKHLEYMMALNDKFDVPFTIDQLWEIASVAYNC